VSWSLLTTLIIIIIMLTVICRQNILRTVTTKEVLILVTNILNRIVLKVGILFVSFKALKI
jgi:hypothetical protein